LGGRSASRCCSATDSRTSRGRSTAARRRPRPRSREGAEDYAPSKSTVR
jgi:hypothetical protein